MSGITDPNITTDRVKLALNRIAKLREFNGRTLLDLPIMYPSGAMVVIDIQRSGEKYWVSDMGTGLIEAEFMGADDFYNTAASNAAEHYSVGYDGNSIFALWVNEIVLESAITCVANASKQAAVDAIDKASEAQSKKQNDKVFEKIASIFGKTNVDRTIEIEGKHTNWSAHNVVNLPNKRKAIFEPMTAHASSVANKFWMFSDIKSANLNISLNVVVRDIGKLDQKLQTIGDVANILEVGASQEEFVRYAEAS